MANRTFYKVADQINSTVNYGALLEDVKKYLQLDPIEGTLSPSQPG